MERRFEMSDPIGLDKLEKRGVKAMEAYLELPDDMSFKEYEKLMQGLGAIADFSTIKLPFYIGDAIIFGQEKFPEIYAQAVEFTGLSHGTLYNYVYVCRNVPKHIRREKLGIAIHQEVAQIKDEARQSGFLSDAELNGWSKLELRKAIKGEPPTKALPDKMPDFREDPYRVDLFEEWFTENESDLAQAADEYEAYRKVWNAGIQVGRNQRH